VTITNVLSVRLGLNSVGGQDVKIFPTSGFGNPSKVRAFEQAERMLGMKLFDGFGAGEVSAHKGRFATDDCVLAGPDEHNLVSVNKDGRDHADMRGKMPLALGLAD
jgi:hypothetical protein